MLAGAIGFQPLLLIGLCSLAVVFAEERKARTVMRLFAVRLYAMAWPVLRRVVCGSLFAVRLFHHKRPEECAQLLRPRRKAFDNQFRFGKFPLDFLQFGFRQFVKVHSRVDYTQPIHSQAFRRLPYIALFLLASCASLENASKAGWEALGNPCPIPIVTYEVADERGCFYFSRPCLKGYYNPNSRSIVIAATPTYREQLAHELYHANLHCRTGNPDEGHTSSGWHLVPYHTAERILERGY